MATTDILVCADLTSGNSDALKITNRHRANIGGVPVCVTGVFDGATVTIKANRGADLTTATEWFALGEAAEFTAPGGAVLDLPALPTPGWYIRAEITSAGGSTSITVAIG